MVIGSGISVLQGIACGKIYLYRKKDMMTEAHMVADAESEVRRVEAAFAAADSQLQRLYEKTLAEAGEEQARIFEGHRMLLGDQEFQRMVRSIIRETGMNGEYAVHMTGRRFGELFLSMEDDYMKARSEDVTDIARRLIWILMGIEEDNRLPEEPVILLAEDLSPSETVLLDRSRIQAFVTRQGSVNSHTAILARSMNIPALVQTDLVLEQAAEGKLAVVDGFTGKIYIDPEPEILESALLQKERTEQFYRELEALKGLDNVTGDGRRINICANIGSPGDVAAVLASDAGGIGLLRSEFIYLGREDYPSEEEQFEVYKVILEAMQGKKVVIRTLDIGADKQAAYLKLPPEANPAMGYRAIRVCLDREEIFRTQLRAIYRAAVYGRASVLFPMITSVKEVRRIKEIIRQIRQELAEEGRAWGEVELGIMIETPAAALTSDLLAKEVDFFSLGTNDLTQYTLAIDRQNQSLEVFYDAHHEAVLRLIKMTVENGHREGIWVGICGELGADLTLTADFLDMGVDEISVAPASVLPLRKRVREINR